MPKSKLLGILLLLLSGVGVSAETVQHDPGATRAMGREVTIVVPEFEEDQIGFFPKGTASVCLEGPSRKQCYTAPRDFGRSPSLSVVNLNKKRALLFEVESGGACCFGIHFALLWPGVEAKLENLFAVDISISNQGEHAFWDEPTISDVPIFVIADYIQGPNEPRVGDHQYLISSYVCPSQLEPRPSATRYYLQDQYMTANAYHAEFTPQVLASEKQEILDRLRRAKPAASENRAQR